ncbi:23S rRNA (pseudouridine(1915)-N(3))-methyltransferase RlmH [Oceanivirga salmonicida]|uniref:23S rRNA (pseudouridine(1915)-N(3))-methyltransferase RlmH n=1 Tax=Oceanivirga salmonicida TaxID=1769291 RepID=UPI000829B74B|nr:23S rRNA (pseudouridine(1915)-N(3))-methyltransferase RlmH [Oceanivirga salmonicida]
MLKINIVAVGKIKEKYIIDGITEYSKRLRPYINFDIVELSESKDNDLALEKDSASILKYLDKTNAYKILLDIGAKQIDSVELSELIEKLSMTNSEIIFIIGGSRGVNKEVRNSCNLRISFSKLTFPHQLFRLILTEQIYRSICIQKNIKYHK